MNFPSEWGPPPAFAGTEVLPDGTTRCIHSNLNSKILFKNISRDTVNKDDDENGDKSDNAASSGLQVFTVENCPTASEELLVKEGEYEGGFAVWESTWDLLGFLQQKEKKSFEVQRLVAGGHVAELGCGHGLPGIWALQNGASSVLFQDLNDHVLQNATKWNILRNTEERLLSASSRLHSSPCRLSLKSTKEETEHYFSSSFINTTAGAEAKLPSAFPLLQGRALCVACAWEQFPNIECSCGAGGESELFLQFNIIFCAEGVYREQSFRPLAALFEKMLAPEGIAVVASKRYYFGVGGGSLSFLHFIKKHFSATLTAEVVSTFKSANSNNFRDILFIKKQEKQNDKEPLNIQAT